MAESKHGENLLFPDVCITQLRDQTIQHAYTMMNQQASNNTVPSADLLAREKFLNWTER